MSTPLRCHNSGEVEGCVSDADEILIGEGVALESGAAPVTLRMLSGVIDVAVTFVVLIVGFAILDAGQLAAERRVDAAISVRAAHGRRALLGYPRPRRRSRAAARLGASPLGCASSATTAAR